MNFNSMANARRLFRLGYVSRLALNSIDSTDHLFSERDDKAWTKREVTR